MARLLLDARGPGGIQLEAAERVADQRLRLTFRRTNGRPLVVHLKSVDAGGAFTRSAHLGVAVEVDQVGERLGAWLHGLAALLGERTLADLFALLEADPDSEGASEPGGDAADERPSDPPAWNRFFDHALEHETWEPSFPDNSMAMVEHADMECFFSHPLPHAHKWAFYNDPRLGLPFGDHRGPPPTPTTLVSELTEQEVVLGSRDQQDRLLRAAAEAGEHCRVLVLNHLCTPVVLGEDLNGLATRLGSASGRPVLQLTRHHKDRQDFLSTLLELLGDAVGGEPPEANPDAVNVLGFSPGFRESELRHWLRDLGLELNAALMPEVTAGDLARLPAAGLNLVCGDGMTARKARNWLTALPQPSVVIPPPYGVKGSRACLQAIAEATRRSGAADACWQTHFEPQEQRWEQLRSAAQGLRLGLVVNHHTWPLLQEPGRLSVPVLALLTDMGFGVELFVAETGGLREATVAREAAALLAAPDPPVCHAVTSLEDLQRALAERDCRAVYTDYSFDWRLSRAGLAQFSLHHFALGIRGALASAQHLLTLARLPFYRQYHQWLAPPSGGPP